LVCWSQDNQLALPEAKRKAANELSMEHWKTTRNRC
jgi:hypothetical protein